jgi:hypothetical protein
MIQTWLPVPGFKASIVTLHQDELTKQRLDCLQLMEFFHEVEDSEFPEDCFQDNIGSQIVGMWKGYELQLIEYALVCCDEWSFRMGQTDPLAEKFDRHLDWATSDDAEMSKPNWFGEPSVHLSHQGELLRLRPKWYERHFDITYINAPLVWPVSDHAEE